MEPGDSLIMGDENRSSIPEKESDEFIKSSVEDLVPIPSESEDTSDNDSEIDLPICDDSPLPSPILSLCICWSLPLVLEDIESEDSYVSKFDKPVFLVTPLSKLNEDKCFNLGGDFILEEIEACLTSDSIPPGIYDDDFDQEGYILLLEKLINDNPSSPLPPKELNFEELKDTIPNLPPEVFLDRDLRSLEDEPGKHDLKNIVKVFDSGIWEITFSPTYVKLPFEDRHYLSLTYAIQNFLPYFTYPVDSSLLLSSGSKDTIFDPDIPVFSFYSLEHLIRVELSCASMFI
ncbi:hypothetical protein Tco_1415771 [Tanacetum coccineum]